MQGYAAYARTQNRTVNPRALEYKLLGQVTGALMKAQEQPADIALAMDAVLWNQQVWSAFLTDLADEGNRLPRELKNTLMNLAIWSIRECDRALDRKGDLGAMIEVNRNIMSGLEG